MQLPIHEQVRLRRVRGMQANQERDEANILDALGRARQPVTPEQLAHEVGMEAQLVRTRIRGLAEKGTEMPNLATGDAALGEAVGRINDRTREREQFRVRIPSQEQAMIDNTTNKTKEGR